MLVNVRTHHLDITAALKEYAKKKLVKLDRFFENIQEITIELDISSASDENKRQIANAIVKASGVLIRAEEANKDMYASIDGIFDKLEAQLKKYKEKLKTKKNKGKKKEIITGALAASHKKKKTDVKITNHLFEEKPIDIDEAAQKLDEEKLTFLVFREIESEEINIIYTMENGDYGLIET